MVTVKELIEQLKTLSEDTVVQVVESYPSGGGYALDTRFVDLNFDTNYEVIDLRQNTYVTDPKQKKAFLRLGET